MSSINVLNNGKSEKDIDLLFDEVSHVKFKEYSSTEDNFSCVLEKESALITIFITGSSIDTAKGGIGCMTLLVWKDKLTIPRTGIHISCSKTTTAPFFKYTQRVNTASTVFNEITYVNRTLTFAPKAVYGFDANIIGYQILYFDE